jgi:cytochrome c peroxidase
MSLGAEWTLRNTTPNVNSAFYNWFSWDGRADSLWQQATMVGENAAAQNSD